ncbi:hypothetical protein [Kitasatospora brasiliensis]|uniref:hypothetical protein n=1 Tax=Kitasatospora brasiliensis TaxID=3058040 RepID=UPI002931A4A9|nr:hypothetical protein [Kitasatospora sp. K002]
MTESDIKGLGRETTDLTVGAVSAVLTAVIDGFLLSRIWRWAGQQTSHEHHAAVVQTTWLVGAVAFTMLLGAAVAGSRSTPQRRWRYAMFSPILCQLLLVVGLIVYLMVNPPRFSIPW